MFKKFVAIHRCKDQSDDCEHLKSTTLNTYPKFILIFIQVKSNECQERYAIRSEYTDLEVLSFMLNEIISEIKVYYL